MPSFITLPQKNFVIKHTWKRLLNYVLSLSLVPHDGTAHGGRTACPLLPPASQEANSIIPDRAVQSPWPWQGGCKREKDNVFPVNVNLFHIFLPFKHERGKILEKKELALAKWQCDTKRSISLDGICYMWKACQRKTTQIAGMPLKISLCHYCTCFPLPTWSESCRWRPSMEITIQNLSNVESIWELKDSFQPEVWLCSFLL